MRIFTDTEKKTDIERRESLALKHSRQLGTLNEVSMRMHGLVKSENIYKEILEIVQEHFHFYHVSFWTVNEEQDKATLRASDGAYSSILHPGFVLQGKGAVIHVINTQKPYLCRDTTKDPNFTTLEMPTETRSSLSVPVISQDSKVTAVINVESIFEGAFEKDDLNLMESVASLVGLALNYTVLYDEINHFNNHLKDTVKEKTKKLREAHERILQQQKLLEKENDTLKTIVSKNYDSEKIIGDSAATKSLVSMIDKIAATKIPVLIQGETGTGRGLVANRIHWKSDRSNKPFIVAKCNSIEKSNIKNELFGCQSTSSKTNPKIGLIEAANGGTLFLDEVSALSMEAQEKLLHFLQTESIYNSNDECTKLNIRILSSTDKDMEQEVLKGKFREDLFYRLNIITLRTPPLRERQEDIPSLIAHFMGQSSPSKGPQDKIIDAQALEAMTQYHWPGNVRELENTVQHMQVLSHEDILRFDNLPFNIKMAKNTILGASRSKDSKMISKSMTLSELEKNHIVQMLSYQQGNKTKTAKMLGITIKTLYNKLYRYKLIEKAADKSALTHQKKLHHI